MLPSFDVVTLMLHFRSDPDDPGCALLEIMNIFNGARAEMDTVGDIKVSCSTLVQLLDLCGSYKDIIASFSYSREAVQFRDAAVSEHMAVLSSLRSKYINEDMVGSEEGIVPPTMGDNLVVMFILTTDAEHPDLRAQPIGLGDIEYVVMAMQQIARDVNPVVAISILNTPSTMNAPLTEEGLVLNFPELLPA